MDEAHQRFTDWLVATPYGVPPRDLAVHAASCPACQQQVGALDALAAIDLGRAGTPQAPPLAEALGWSNAARRSAALVGGVVVLAALAFAGWRTFVAPAAPVAGADPSPTQAVLGGAGSPQPSASLGTDESLAPASLEPDGSAAPTPTIPPFIGPPAPGQTPFPPVVPSSGPLPSSGPGVTPRPSSAATPSSQPTAPPTPEPTTPPTPEPTAPPTPEPPTPEPTPEPPTPPPASGECTDNIDNDGDLLIDLLDPGCLLGLRDTESLL